MSPSIPLSAESLFGEMMNAEDAFVASRNLVGEYPESDALIEDVEHERLAYNKALTCWVAAEINEHPDVVEQLTADPMFVAAIRSIAASLEV